MFFISASPIKLLSASMDTVSPWRNHNPSLPAKKSDLIDEYVNDDLSLESASNQSLSSSSTQYANPNVVPALLHLSFNQHHGCFAAGTDRGFIIYNCDSFRELYSVQLRGIAIVEMLLKCNYCALVGGGSYPEFPPTKVMVWDNLEKTCIVELSFRCQVRAVKLRGDRIVVVLKQKIFVYNLYDQELLHAIETIDNPKGLCAISQVSGLFVLVCPGLCKGHIRVEHYSTKTTKLISAHDSRIACLALSQDGKLVATASTKGTLVRIFNTLDGCFLQEVRRGADRADIYSLAFCPISQWLAVSSDKGTVHVFAVKGSSGMPESSFSLLKRVLPKYFSSEWSVAQFRLLENIKYIVGFGHEKNTIVIVGMDGSFYRCQFDPVKGGEMIQLQCHHFLTLNETF